MANSAPVRARKKRRSSVLFEEGAGKIMLRLQVNGEWRDVATEGSKTLLEVLREDMGLTGTKHGCELGECGTCTVLMNGEPVLSCLLLGAEAEDAEIETIEGMAQKGQPHPLQRAFAALGATQCGYCIPGILLTAKVLLDKNPHPSRKEIRQALSGNLCRCTGYTKILEAVELATRGEEAR
ncbi:MAG: (2Fe-2S)-binding protein [Candidatus Binatia bacterium]